MTTATVTIAALKVAPGAIFLTASSQGKPVGDAALYVRGASAQLLGIGVVPLARRQGVAAQLLDRVCAEARLRGAVDVVLETRFDNVEARRVFGRAGFVEVGTRDGYWSVMRYAL